VDLGLILQIDGLTDGLEQAPVTEVELILVAAPIHPLAQLPGPLADDVLREHVQLVLTDRSRLTAGRDHGVVALQTWRLSDLGAKHAMLLAGLGWGSMPAHIVEEDLAAGRLVRLVLERWDGRTELPRLRAVAAHAAGRVLGPAGRWLFAALAGRPEVQASLAFAPAK
jgi:DNA-binding transcriptional LysR family regulator